MFAGESPPTAAGGARKKKKKIGIKGLDALMVQPEKGAHTPVANDSRRGSPPTRSLGPHSRGPPPVPPPHSRPDAMWSGGQSERPRMGMGVSPSLRPGRAEPVNWQDMRVSVNLLGYIPKAGEPDSMEDLMGECGTPGVNARLCFTCHCPIAVYGRLEPCFHIFCFDCAHECFTHGSCNRCNTSVARILKLTFSTPLFECGACMKSFLEQDTLQQHEFSSGHVASRSDPKRLPSDRPPPYHAPPPRAHQGRPPPNWGAPSWRDGRPGPPPPYARPDEGRDFGPRRNDGRGRGRGRPGFAAPPRSYGGADLYEDPAPGSYRTPTTRTFY